MTKRRFQLPGIHELSKEQELAIRLPMDGCHLIVGGPGTGKTVVTLLRLRRALHQQKAHETYFLVYNHLLHAAARQIFAQQMNSSTWISWFMRLYTKHLKAPVPTIQSESTFQPIDWAIVAEKIAQAELAEPPEKTYLFIDEGQDMPVAFYDALIRMGFENFYVVCDQNQAITSNNCSRKQLEEVLAIDAEAVVELKHNYRNNFFVAQLAKAFHPGDPATPPVGLPPESGPGQPPLMIEYGPGCRIDFPMVIERVLKMADRDPSKLIGIITPNNRIRTKYLEALDQTIKSGAIAFDNPIPRTATYAHGDNCNVRFDEGGIMVINAKSCKGLEFDTVLIADINAFLCYPAIEDEMKRLFYVMVARAREQVFMLKETGVHCPVAAILPESPDILTNWR